MLAGKKVAVVGMGASGVSAARLCLAQGASVVGLDEAPAEKLPAARALADRGAIELVTRPFTRDMLVPFDLVVVSPGVPDNDAIAHAEQRGIEVIGELEIASRFLTAPIVLIGGTNGKSTTTALVATILEAAGKKVFLGGNYGTPLANAVGGDYDVLVVEISSFQAERVPTLHAYAHALLNITDDHLDRYASFDAYAHAKGNPFARMTTEDVAIIPHGDALCARQAARGSARVLTFSASDTAADSHFKGDLICCGQEIEVRRSLLRLSGLHNVLNACAAVGVAATFDLGPFDRHSEVIERAFSSFQALGHRCVLVAEIEGVRYYDDSKGTNVGASVAALVGLVEARAVLIAGGRDKQGAYEPLVDALRAKGRALVVIGEAADRIAAAARGALPIERASSMDDAVNVARSVAQPGDAVLLSPACSSFDMFANYKERGDAFVRAVERLRGGPR
jgi:UDP-N-acetylmuramoylalanine--D-glutamate ligase